MLLLLLLLLLELLWFHFTTLYDWLKKSRATYSTNHNLVAWVGRIAIGAFFHVTSDLSSELLIKVHLNMPYKNVLIYYRFIPITTTTRFHALGVGYVYLLRVLIGSFLVTGIVITLVLVYNRSIGETVLSTSSLSKISFLTSTGL